MASVVDINDLDFDFGIVEDSSAKKVNADFAYGNADFANGNADFANGNADFFSDPFGENEFSSALADNPDLEGKYSDENVPLEVGKHDLKILKYDEIFGDDPFKENAVSTNQPGNDVNNEFDPFSPISGKPDSSNSTDLNQEFGFNNQFDSDFKAEEIGDALNNNPQKLPDLVLSENLPTVHNDCKQSFDSEKEAVAVSISDVPICFEEEKTTIAVVTSKGPDHIEQNEKENAEDTVDLSHIMSSLKDQAQDIDGEFDFDLAQNHEEKQKTKKPNDTDQVKENQNEINSEKSGESMKPLVCNVTQDSPNVREVPAVLLGENLIREDDGLIVSSSAVTEWENVETIQPEFRGEKPSDSPQVRKSGPLYTFNEAYSTLQQADYSAVKPNIKSSVDRSGLAAFVHFVFGPPKLHRDLIQNRDFVFYLSSSSFDDEQPSHSRMLQTIYRLITGSRFDSPRFGPHWEEIGFQGHDPSTDLRGVGVLGLVQLLYFLQHNKYGQIARDIYKLSLHPTQNFPFCVMGMNISRICLQSLREDILNKEINRRKDVIVSLNDFYVGAYLHMYKIWKMGRTIGDSGYVLKDVETFAKKRSKDIYKNLEQYLIEGDGKSNKPEKGDEFFSVC